MAQVGQMSVIWDLFCTVVDSVAVVCVIALAGAVLSRVGIINKAVKSGLAEINMALTIPALLFTRMLQCKPRPPALGQEAGSGCSSMWEDLTQSWVLLVGPLGVVGMGLLLGKFMTMLFPDIPDDCKGPIIAAVAFANSTGLPIIVLAVIFDSEQSKRLMVDPSLYLPNYLVVYPILQWSIGAYLFGVGEPKANDMTTASVTPLAPPSPTAAGAAASRAALAPPRTMTLGGECDATTSIELAERNAVDDAEAGTSTTNGVSAPSPPSAGAVVGAGGAGGAARPAAGSSASTVPRKSTWATWASTASSAMLNRHGTFASRSVRTVTDATDATDAVADAMASQRSVFGTVKKSINQPPVIAILFGLFVGLCPCPAYGTFRGLFVDISGTHQHVPLQWLFTGVLYLGHAAVPVNMLILGAALANGSAFSALPLKANLAVVLAKLVVMPAIVFFFVCLVRPSLLQGLPVKVANTIWFVLLAVTSTPTANNIQAMATLGNQNADAAAAIAFLQYIFAPIFLTASLVVILASLEDPLLSELPPSGLGVASPASAAAAAAPAAASLSAALGSHGLTSLLSTLLS